MAGESTHLAEDMMDPFRYEKPGARIAIYPDRLEMTTGFLWAKKTHVVPLRAVIGVSVTS